MLKIRLGLLLVVSLLTYSCSQKKWTEKNKKDFIEGCIKSNKNRFSEKIAKDACDCMLNKMMQKYSTLTESQKMKREEVKEMAISCWELYKKPKENLVLHQTKNGEIGFLLNNWTNVELGNSDLKCTNGQAYMTVLVQNIKDFKAGTTKKDFLDMYVKNLMSKRGKVKEEKALKKKINSDKLKIYQAVYSADTDVNRNLYLFNVIDFGEDVDTFAVVIFNSRPSYGEENIESWNNILKTAKIFKKQTPQK